MKRSPTWLLEYQRNVYSQSGEDGILEKILEILPETDRWCVEFGAADGRFLSNSRHLIESSGYSAVLIEGSAKKYRDLQRNYAEHRHVRTLNRFVGFGSADNLDHLLEATPVPREFDLLSIDIDGNDYHVWTAVTKYRPKVVVVEFNPTIPTHVRFVQAADPSVSQGASLLSLAELGKEKGYELVSVLPFNAFFIQEEYYPLFEIECNAPALLRTDLSYVTDLFSGYDGSVFLRGACGLPWHPGVALKESQVQVLPRALRRFTSHYTIWQKVLFALYRPGVALRMLQGARQDSR